MKQFQEDAVDAYKKVPYDGVPVLSFIHWSNKSLYAEQNVLLEDVLLDL